MKFEITDEHATAIINMLGETPAKNGAWPLYLDLIEQLKQNRMYQAQPVNTTAIEVPTGDK